MTDDSEPLAPQQRTVSTIMELSALTPSEADTGFSSSVSSSSDEEAGAGGLGVAEEGKTVRTVGDYVL